MTNREPKGLFVLLGGVPTDLNSGMLDAIANPPAGFISRNSYAVTDVPARARAIRWFSNCGRNDLQLALSMPVRVASNDYLPEGHTVFFFLELLSVFEAGHLPCGWEGEWPTGTLVVY